MSGSASTAQRALERGLVRIRWFAVAFGLFQIWQLSSNDPRPPAAVVPASYATILLLAAGNILISSTAARTSSVPALRRLGTFAFALDIAVIVANVWIGSYDRYATSWTLAYVLPLEGAIRYQMRGSVATVALFSASELAREFYRLWLFSDLSFEISSVTFRVGIFAIIAAVAGIMARNLERQRAAAERHAAELQTHAEREAQLLAQERETVERLRELDRMKSDFVAVTSHELRTPLTSIAGFIKTIRRPDISLEQADIQEFLAIVDRQADRLSRLVEDLLLTARIEAGTIDLHLGSVDVASLLEETAEELEPARSRVQLAVEPSLPAIVTDAHRVGQIVHNLIENALKFSPGERPVRVTVLTEDHALLVEVTDRGRGIPQHELPSIFDRFHQVGDTLQRRSRGLGLGLFIVRNLVDALNGSIEVRSTVGEGTTFSVRLPLVPSLAVEESEGA